MTVYLDHAATSWPKPEPVRAAVRAALDEDPGDRARTFAAHHRAVAAWLGVSDPSRLLLTPGCTSALALGVADLPWAPGDRVLTSGFEHEALRRPVQALARRGVEHVVVPPAGDAPLDREALARELATGRARLVAFSAASNVTGALLPIREIVALAHAHGALVLLDAAQAAGWLALDVAALDVDLLAFAGHKGPQAPWGVGGLYVAPRVAMRGPSAARAEPGAMPGYCDGGSVDRAALAGLAAGLDWLAARPDRLERARRLVETLADGLSDLPGLRLHGPPIAARVPTLALTVDGVRPDALARRLAARGVVASGGRQCAPLAHRTLGTAPDGVLRLSVGPSTRPEDVARALEALGRALSARG